MGSDVAEFQSGKGDGREGECQKNTLVREKFLKQDGRHNRVSGALLTPIAFGQQNI